LNEALRTEEIRKSVERELIESDAKADDPGRDLPAGSLESKD
jgi:hypothetical protein